ncbi:unnamed protein product [Adineta steineri]|uniref:Uncharacterized protein n=1 Tax=Adineta steineri TaxID=433720 RepID=A0A815F2S3_9BILA|nr:unnamed protein product [Adineta steineri]
MTFLPTLLYPKFLSTSTGTYLSKSKSSTDDDDEPWNKYESCNDTTDNGYPRLQNMSGRTRDNKMCGNFQGALEASKSAKLLNIAATVIGSIAIITLIILAATKTITIYTYSY